MSSRVIDWPAAAGRLLTDSWFLSTSTVTPGRGLDGTQQVLASENRYWVNNVSIAAMRDRNPGLWRAFVTDLQGSFGLMRLPVYNGLTYRFTGNMPAFLAQFGLAPDASGIPFSDGSKFSDGTGFALPETADPTVSADVPAAATRLQFDGFLGRNLRIGGFFSVNDFLYQVLENADGAVRFAPPLREAIAAGTVAKVNAPSIIVRLATDDAARLTLGFGHLGTVDSFDVAEARQR